MQIGVIGLNHKSAPLELREKLARSSAKQFGGSNEHDLPYVLLSTCNRTEIYFTSEDLAATHSYLLANLRCEISEEFEHKIYSYFGGDCFFHLAKVTSGMDSAILGETEIQGQVKQAYETAAKQRPLCSELHFLFQKSLKIGKEIRTEPLRSCKEITSQSEGIPLRALMPTLEDSILNLSTGLLKDLKTKKILFFGVSEINQKILKKFIANNIRSITLCNRSYLKAHLLAKAFGIGLKAWEEIGDVFEYDLIIYGTKSPSYLMTKEGIKTLPKEPKVVIDLSVPRNVEPACGTLLNVTLLNIDQINCSIDRRKRRRADSISRMRLPQIGQAVELQMALYGKRQRFLLSAI